MKRAALKRLVVVGNGMAGMNCLEQILKHEPRFTVTCSVDTSKLVPVTSTTKRRVATRTTIRAAGSTSTDTEPRST